MGLRTLCTLKSSRTRTGFLVPTRTDTETDSENRSPANRAERRRMYEYRQRVAIRAFVNGALSFAQMTEACDKARDWYHRQGSYRERSLADPHAYRMEEKR
jgi:hypothetical protein